MSAALLSKVSQKPSVLQHDNFAESTFATSEDDIANSGSRHVYSGYPYFGSAANRQYNIDQHAPGTSDRTGPENCRRPHFWSIQFFRRTKNVAKPSANTVSVQKGSFERINSTSIAHGQIDRAIRIILSPSLSPWLTDRASSDVPDS